MYCLYQIIAFGALTILSINGQKLLWQNIHLSEIFDIPCGTNKVCMKTVLCNGGKVNTDGRKVIHIRLGVGVKENVCQHYLDTCCSLNDTVDTRSTLTNIGATSEVCGQHNEKGVSISLSDASKDITQFGEFPWMMAILKDGNLICGGGLISKSIVLTVAHCVVNEPAGSLIVRAGEWDTKTDKEPLPHEERHVSRAKIHENYHDEDENFYYDIAMLILERPFELKPHINTICLPDSELVFDNAHCFVTGWGKDKFGKEGSPQVFLKKIELSVVPSNVCQSQLRNTMLGRFFNLHESFVCAGGQEGKDACEGDGGSPLVCQIPGQENRFQMAGLVAWGIECGLKDIPGVYTNIPYLRQWIDKNLPAS